MRVARGPGWLWGRRRGGARASAKSSGSIDFKAPATGLLRTGGFSPTDEVGTSRRDYAAAQLPNVKIDIQQGNFDPQKFAAQSAAGQVPDVVQMDLLVRGHVRGEEADHPLDKCFSDNGVDPAKSLLPDGRSTDVTYKGPALCGAAVLPAPGGAAQHAGDEGGRRHQGRHRHLQARLSCWRRSRRCTRRRTASRATLGLDPRNGLVSNRGCSATAGS